MEQGGGEAGGGHRGGRQEHPRQQEHHHRSDKQFTRLNTRYLLVYLAPGPLRLTVPVLSTVLFVHCAGQVSSDV